MKRALLSAAMLIAAPISAQVQNGPRMGLDGSIHSPNTSYSITGTSGGAAFNSATVGLLAASTVTLSGAGAGASLYKQLPSECSNILAYGGDMTGSADNSAAFNAAVAASPVGRICVYLPAGTYKFASTPAIALSGAGVSATIKGDGADATQLVMAAGVTGPTVALNARMQNFHIRDMTIAASAVESAASGISVSSTVFGPPAQSDISNVAIRGTDGYGITNRFQTAVLNNGVSNINFINDIFDGATGGTAYASSTINSYGVKIVGNATTTPVQFNFIGCQINFWSYAIGYGSYVQGLSIGQSNFVGNAVSVYLPDGNVGNDQLAITGSQFNDSGYNVYVGGQLDGFAVSGNMFYVYGNPLPSSNVGSNIFLKQAGQYAISANGFIGLSPSGGTAPNGVTVGTWLLDAGVISGNQFKNLSSAVFLQSGSQHVNVQSNSYSANVENVVNQGTHNTVGGGSQ